MHLLFATHNLHKLKEAKVILGSFFEVMGLSDLPEDVDLIETGDSLEANAAIKVDTVWHFIVDRGYHSRYDIRYVFADDTGLEISALDGKPGVMTARWAGDVKDDAMNRKKALLELRDKKDRSACFRTVVTLTNGQYNVFFEGVLRGYIGEKEVGINGFGYDSIFVPVMSNDRVSKLSLAQMDENEKNHISHRYKALFKMRTFLLNQQ